MHDLNQIIQSKISWKKREATNVLDKDWDNLIILDACRHDMFEEVIGESESIYSAGSNSANWRNNTFGSGNYPEIVYVSANPHISSVRAEEYGFSFHEIKDVWDYGWDDEADVVLPETMVEETIKAAEEHPDKKIISHFMQPHAPYLGEHGWEPEFVNVWDDVRARKVSTAKAKKALQENLEIAYPHAVELGEKLDGKTVVTSDHGEFLGERGVYGHGLDDFHHPAIRKVPWKTL